jgi:hypothetical protein
MLYIAPLLKSFTKGLPAGYRDNNREEEKEAIDFQGAVDPCHACIKAEQ